MSTSSAFVIKVSLLASIIVVLLSAIFPLALGQQQRYTLDSFNVAIDLPFNGTDSTFNILKNGNGYSWKCIYDSGWAPDLEIRNQIISDIYVRDPSVANSNKFFQQERATIQMYVDDLKSHENITTYKPMDTLVEFTDTPNRTSYVFKRTIDSSRPTNMASGYGGQIVILHANGYAEISWFVADYDLTAAQGMVQAIEDRCYELWEGSGAITPTVSATFYPTSTPYPVITPSPIPSWDYTEWLKPSDYSVNRYILSMSGTVEVRPLGSDKWYPAYSGLRLGGGWKLRTLEDGKAEVSFPGNRLCTMYSESSMDVPLWSEYYGSKRRLSDLTITDFIELLRGRLYMWIKYGNETSGVITSNAIAGDKGTGFEVIVDDGGTTFNVFEGELIVSDLNMTRNVSVRANQTARVPNGGLAQDPALVDKVTSDAWWAWRLQVPDDVFDATPTPLPTNPPATATPKSPAPGLLATIVGVLLVGYLFRCKTGR